MNILILTPSYYPLIHPRAHRWTALAEHWASRGHRVRVVCARKRGYREQEVHNGVQIFRCGFESLQAWLYFGWPGVQRRGRVGEQPTRSGGVRTVMEWIYTNLWKRLYFPDDAMCWIRPAVRLGVSLIQKERPDVLITVSLPFSAQVVGNRLKEQFPDLYWLADMGDPYAIQSPPLVNRFLYGRRAEILEKKVLERADRVVVTNEALRSMLVRHYRLSAPDRLRIIPPLLWPLPPEVEYRPDESRIRLVYGGALYAGLREPADFLTWLDRLLMVRPDWQGRLELHWYGEVAPAFYDQLASRPWVFLHGLCPREEVQRALASADVLINIGNQSNMQLPSKVVDYLASGRPVIHFQVADPDPFVDFWPFSTNLFIISNAGTAAPSLENAIHFIENAQKTTGQAPVLDYLKEWLPDHLGDLYLQDR